MALALAVYPVGVARAWMTRTDAVTRTLAPEINDWKWAAEETGKRSSPLA